MDSVAAVSFFSLSCATCERVMVSGEVATASLMVSSRRISIRKSLTVAGGFPIILIHGPDEAVHGLSRV